MQKSWGDRARRLKLFACALDLLRHTTFIPTSKENPNKKHEILHRFCGTTRDNEPFFVQVRENKQSGQKTLMSIFPED